MIERDVRWAVSRVLRSPRRLFTLAAFGPAGLVAFARFLRRVVPLASAALAQVESRARRIPDDELRAQALASIDGKAYHVAGAAVLATFLPPGARERYVRLVAPLESIYDYLDNLCDRHPNVLPPAYPVLHRALTDALDPASPKADYYAGGPLGSDGGYLEGLVDDVRAQLTSVRGYAALIPTFREAAKLYAELQTYKHLPARARETACRDWFDRNRAIAGDLAWFEFAAATGSQFQVYAPLFALFAGRAGSAETTFDAYFPEVAALHVLLDAFIDQDEDASNGELNLASCYPSFAAFRHRAGELAARARRKFRALPQPGAHTFVLRVMALFYLTHRKVFDQRLNAEALRLLAAIT